MKGKSSRDGNTGTIRLLVWLGIIILSGALVIGAYGETVVSDALNATSTSAQTQNYVFTAMQWLGTNTPNNSIYLAVSDYRFTYSSAVINRTTYYTYIYSPAVAISAAKNVSAQYIIVTNAVTASVPNYSELYPWNNFPSGSNSNFSLVYNSTDVRIFQIRF